MRYSADMPTLRPYTAKDWPHFLELDLQTAQEGLGTDSTESERATLRERWPALLDVNLGFSKAGFRRPGAQLWVLEGDGGKYIGHVWISEKDDTVYCTRTLEVTTMGVVVEERGKGYGRLLMLKAEQEAKARGIELIVLSVAGHNRRAREIYDELGYETVASTLRKRLRD